MKIEMKKIILAFASVIVTLGLLSFSESINGVIDLTPKGIPVTLNAPEGAIIEEGIGNGLETDGVMWYVWEVNKGAFSLEISMDSDKMYQEAEEYVEFSRDFAEDDDFEDYVLEEPNGFIYKYSLDGEVYYGLYYLLVKNGRAIEFATGFSSDDSDLENVREIYAAAKGAK